MGIDIARPRAVFLDRDGTINRPVVRDGKPYPPATVDELEVLPGVAEALGLLRQAGYRLVVVTNQPDIARGTQRIEVVEAMHRRLMRVLPLDEIRVCPHDDADGCGCRKPAPGLLQSAAREAGLDLAQSYLVGDRWRDIAAGRRAGCTTIFIDWGYDETRPDHPDFTASSLGDAAAWILAHSGSTRG